LKTNYTILVVDDEKPAVEMIRESLQEKYEVITAQNGKDALKILKTEEIHLILTDEQMPGMSGLELLAEVKRLFLSLVPSKGSMISIK